MHSNDQPSAYYKSYEKQYILARNDFCKHNSKMSKKHSFLTEKYIKIINSVYKSTYKIISCSNFNRIAQHLNINIL